MFCRYIQTANYLEEVLKPELEKAYPGIAVEAVTSELNDEQRKERVDALGDAKRRVLIATDCLSEGINLQQHFTAVVHYDLPWNPNRIEQREGRIDRYGQAAAEVKTLLMIGDNPIDGVIVNVLLRKTRKIRNDTGISIPFPEDSKSVTDALTHAVLLNPEAARMQPTQLSLGMEFEAVQARKSEVSDALDDALNRELGTRSIFKQLALKPDEIEPDLRETDEALGSPETVERFMLRAAAHLGVQLEPRSKKHSYRLVTAGLPPILRDALPGADEDDAPTLKVTFHSPVPEGHLYLGRNHPFVEQTCQYLMRMAFDPDRGTPPGAGGCGLHRPRGDEDDRRALPRAQRDRRQAGEERVRRRGGAHVGVRGRRRGGAARTRPSGRGTSCWRCCPRRTWRGPSRRTGWARSSPTCATAPTSTRSRRSGRRTSSRRTSATGPRSAGRPTRAWSPCCRRTSSGSTCSSPTARLG